MALEIRVAWESLALYSKYTFMPQKEILSHQRRSARQGRAG